jgi:hypothetical protein
MLYTTCDTGVAAPWSAQKMGVFESPESLPGYFMCSSFSLSRASRCFVATTTARRTQSDISGTMPWRASSCVALSEQWLVAGTVCSQNLARHRILQHSSLLCKICLASFNGDDPLLLSSSISPTVHFSSANGLAWICTLSILTGCCGLLFLSTGIASIASRVSHPSNTLPNTVFFPSR